MTILPADPGDLHALRQLLAAQHLPLDGEDGFLLTTTAEQFFPKLGFEQISREDVPRSVQGSAEFQSACPASATVMRKRLT